MAALTERATAKAITKARVWLSSSTSPPMKPSNDAYVAQIAPATTVAMKNFGHGWRVAHARRAARLGLRSDHAANPREKYRPMEYERLSPAIAPAAPKMITND